MGETTLPASNQRPPVHDWMTIVQFDGRGGVRKLEEAEEAGFVTPAKGFALISGNSRAPEFKVWLKRELGDFYADLVTVPSTRSRCTVFDDRALVVLRVARPGAEPEDLLRLTVPALIVPGRDDSHATSAARYLEECLPKSEYWDAPVEQQTEQTAPPRMLSFLDSIAR